MNDTAKFILGLFVSLVGAVAMVTADAPAWAVISTSMILFNIVYWGRT